MTTRDDSVLGSTNPRLGNLAQEPGDKLVQNGVRLENLISATELMFIRYRAASTRLLTTQIQVHSVPNL